MNQYLIVTFQPTLHLTKTVYPSGSKSKITRNAAIQIKTFNITGEIRNLLVTITYT